MRTYHILIILPLLLLNIHCKPLSNTTSEKAKLDLATSITTIAFGSCNKQYEDQSYWDIISKENPDLFVWTGDIVYSDTDNPSFLENQYNIQKTNHYYSKFITKTPVIGIWDDHEYGVNDGGKNNPIKKEARDLLFDFLDVPQDNKDRNHEGAYQSYTFGENEKSIKFILLDARYFRDELKDDPSGKERYLHDSNGTILGQTQWKWLKNELYNSTASINVIVSGIQIISSQHRFEKWENFPNERIKLLNLIKDSKVKNPIFWSGDRHVAEISQYTYPSDNTTILDITCSGLTHSYLKANEDNKYRISPLIGKRNFGILNINWKTDNIEINYKIKGFKGEDFITNKLTIEYNK